MKLADIFGLQHERAKKDRRATIRPLTRVPNSQPALAGKVLYYCGLPAGL